MLQSVGKRAMTFVGDCQTEYRIKHWIINNKKTTAATPLPPPDNIGNEQWRIHHDKQHW